jgi:NAD(P)H-nitrite reductase large subunit
MQTNMEGIFAAGDIAEVREQIEGRQGTYAIWPNAVEQGRVAGLNMAGVRTVYGGADVVNVLDVFDIPVVAIGNISETLGETGEMEETEVIARSTPHDHKKLLLGDGRLLGLQFVGTIRNTGTLYSFMKKGRDVGGMKDRLLDDNFVHAPTGTGPPSGRRPPQWQ